MTQQEAITADLESALVYSCIVAGKSAVFTDAVMKKLKAYLKPGESFFQMFKRNRFILKGILIDCGTGNYEKLYRCFVALSVASSLDLGACEPSELEQIHGIGPKTSRFFILWTRDNANFAALDVHILRWLKTEKGYPNIPRTTPTGEEYLRIEKIFLEEARKAEMTARELDREIWMKGSGYVLS